MTRAVAAVEAWPTAELKSAPIDFMALSVLVVADSLIGPKWCVWARDAPIAGDR